MNRFILARHGETLNNRAKRLSGWIDTPLTPNGLEPTERVIAKLQNTTIDAVYASDLGRAFITAYTICHGLGLTTEIVAVPGFREVSYGDAANMKSAEAYELYPRLDRDTDFVPPNGESLHVMQARTLENIIAIDAAHTDKTVLVVAHSGTMAALNSSCTGEDFGAHNISEAYAHDFVAELSIVEGKIATFEPFSG